MCANDRAPELSSCLCCLVAYRSPLFSIVSLRPLTEEVYDRFLVCDILAKWLAVCGYVYFAAVAIM